MVWVSRRRGECSLGIEKGGYQGTNVCVCGGGGGGELKLYVGLSLVTRV